MDKLCGNNHFASTDMRQCVTKLTNRYTFFEARLRERGNILRLSMVFHRHLEKVHICEHVVVVYRCICETGSGKTSLVT